MNIKAIMLLLVGVVPKLCPLIYPPEMQKLNLNFECKIDRNNKASISLDADTGVIEKLIPLYLATDDEMRRSQLIAAFESYVRNQQLAENIYAIDLAMRDDDPTKFSKVISYEESPEHIGISIAHFAKKALHIYDKAESIDELSEDQTQNELFMRARLYRIATPIIAYQFKELKGKYPVIPQEVSRAKKAYRDEMARGGHNSDFLSEF